MTESLSVVQTRERSWYLLLAIATGTITLQAETYFAPMTMRSWLDAAALGETMIAMMIRTVMGFTAARSLLLMMMIEYLF